MTLTYYFRRYRDGESEKEVAELVKELYDEELQKWAKEEFNINSSNDIVLDKDVLYELRSDDIEDYYRDNAEEEYEDYKLYIKDPLGYYGMRQFKEGVISRNYTKLLNIILLYIK